MGWRNRAPAEGEPTLATITTSSGVNKTLKPSGHTQKKKKKQAAKYIFFLCMY